ncbi:MAG: hypothetical protein GXP08_13970 [Gammaproteobacteria bacterium]|nr:hypothetical protein [Gammaproteobacteria bacterium]
MDKLDKSIKNYYLDRRLSADALDRMLDKGHQVAREKATEKVGIGKLFDFQKSKRFIASQWRTSAVAAVMLVVIVVAQSYYFQRGVSELVLAEIAMNHNKHLDVEFPYNNYEALRVAMNRLDFTLEPPVALLQNFILIGGRYCSIQGKLAAQLKVKNRNTDGISTLYVTALTDKLKKTVSKRVVYDNVTIELWQNQGHFYGLATDA